ncbi:SpoIIE family protein phosphatase [Streptomyces aureocirculatus]|uniref:SpoIIE family protein phosphatase n=1 Tax=Streptomyces aureocirculatus TaxID=67275 RepID=UPI00069070B6|nr:SpoIIE family protein phosphatase [Streptomyces aureocirculatus]
MQSGQRTTQAVSSALQSAPWPLLLAGADGRVRWANPAARALFPGVSAGTELARHAPLWLAEAHARRDSAAAGNVAGRTVRAEAAAGERDDVLWWLHDDTGPGPVRRALRTERERARLLADASRQLSGSFDLRGCRANAALLAARHLADAAVVVGAARGTRRPFAAAVRDGEVTHGRLAGDAAEVPGLAEALEGFPPVPSRWLDPGAVPGWLAPGFVGVAGEGEAAEAAGAAGAGGGVEAAGVGGGARGTGANGVAGVVEAAGAAGVAGVGGAPGAGGASGADGAAGAARAGGGVGALMVASLPGGGGPVGALVLMRAAGAEPFSEDEEAFVRAFATCTGAALETARLRSEHTAVAELLTQDLLPPGLRRVDGVEYAGGHRPAHGELEVGGDFFDISPATEDGGETHVVLGDVCGKGLEAAVLTGKIRSTLRALHLVEPDHGQLLRVLNSALLSTRHSRFATLVLASARRRGDTVALRLTSAGHPPPLIVRLDGGVVTAPTHGTLVGALPEVTTHTHHTTLRPGEACLLYSDGVTEAKGGPLGTDRFGEERLRAALAEYAGKPPEAMAERVQMLVADWLGGRHHDDMALMVIAAPRTPDTPHADAGTPRTPDTPRTVARSSRTPDTHPPRPAGDGHQQGAGR